MKINSRQLSAISNQYPRRGERPFAPTTSYWLLGNRGFALISVIIILSLLGIATGVATSFAHRLKTSRRQSATEDELKALKEAILGNPREYSKEGRSGFGYLGDMGGIPATLADLYDNTTSIKPAYALGTAGQGAGWAGPYITPILREDLPDLLVDPYGNTYSYPTTPDHPTVPYQRASDNEWVSAIIRSIGPNKTDDGGAGDDKQVEILRREIRSTVSGYVTYPDGTAIIDGTPVTLYRPVVGSVSGINATTISGLYTFTAGAPNVTDVPYGIRTITASTASTAGKLQYAPNSVLADGNNLNFNITNWGATAVTVTSIRLDYTFTPTSYYGEVYVGGTQIFKYDDPGVPNYNGGNRWGTGDTLTIPSPITVNGGTYTSTTRVLVDSDNVLLPNIVLYPRGGTLNIRYSDFNWWKDPPGQWKPTDEDDIYGQTFTVVFNDSISIPFTAPEEED